MYFRYFVIISLWKRAGTFIWKTWISFTLWCFVPSLVQIGPVVLEKKMKIWKVYDNNDNNDNDDHWQTVIRKAHLSLRLREDKNRQRWGICYILFFLYRRGIIYYLRLVINSLPESVAFIISTTFQRYQLLDSYWYFQRFYT